MNQLVELLAIADHAEGRLGEPSELWVAADSWTQEFYRRRAERIIAAAARTVAAWMR